MQEKAGGIMHVRKNAFMVAIAACLMMASLGYGASNALVAWADVATPASLASQALLRDNYGTSSTLVFVDTSNEDASGVATDFATNEKLSRAAASAGSDDAALAAGQYDAIPTVAGLPSEYAYTDLAIRDQGIYSFCWSFSAIACVEESAVRHGLADNSIDLSEMQLAYFALNKKGVADPLCLITGDYNISRAAKYYDNWGHNDNTMWVLASWCGAADEASAPYPVVDYTAESADPDPLDSSLAYAADSYHVNGVQIIPYSRRDSIKQAIMTDGGVSLSFYFNDQYYNYENNCYYDPADYDTNHMVAVVGWDDDFAKENFETTQYKRDENGYFIWDDDGEPIVDEAATAATVPSSNGAWLVKNSWGGTWDDGFNEAGYFWISYENSAFKRYGSMGYAYSVEPATSHDNNYQYDGTASDSTNYITAGSSVANVYTASGNAGGHEILDAIGIGLRSVQVTYSVQIYGDLTDPNDPTSGRALLDTPVTGTTGYAGYVTIPLNQEIELAEGEKFSVVFTNTGSRGITISLDNSTNSTGYLTCVAQTDPQQSFRRSNGTWSDYATLGVPSCARIKAFTRNVAGELAPNLVATASTTPVACGEKAKFTCTTSQDLGSALSYQWYWSRNGGSKWTPSTLSGATTAELQVSATSSRAQQLYRCQVTAADGRVTWTDPVGFDITLAATVTTTPVALGKMASFACSVTGSGSYTPKYQWQYSTNGGKTWKKSTLRTARVATLKAYAYARRVTAGQLYRCVVTCGNWKITTDPITFLTK